MHGGMESSFKNWVPKIFVSEKIFSGYFVYLADMPDVSFAFSQNIILSSFFWLTMTITENPILSSPNPLRNFYWEEYDIVICMKCIYLHNWWWLYKVYIYKSKERYCINLYFSVRVCWSKPSWTAGGTRRTSSVTRTGTPSASTTRTPSTASGRGCPSRLSIQYCLDLFTRIRQSRGG